MFLNYGTLTKSIKWPTKVGESFVQLTKENRVVIYSIILNQSDKVNLKPEQKKNLENSKKSKRENTFYKKIIVNKEKNYRKFVQNKNEIDLKLKKNKKNKGKIVQNLFKNFI